MFTKDPAENSDLDVKDAVDTIRKRNGYIVYLVNDHAGSYCIVQKVENGHQVFVE